jgi:endoribonuclease Dicer
MEIALKNHSVKSESEFVPYNLVTQQSIPDKSIADCVEALIGAYLTSMGPQGALLFMSWLGMRVLPSSIISEEDLQTRLKNDSSTTQNPLIYLRTPLSQEVILFQKLTPPKSPLLRYDNECEDMLEILLKVHAQNYYNSENTDA